MDCLVGYELLKDCIQRAGVNKLSVQSDKWCPSGSHTRLFSISTVDIQWQSRASSANVLRSRKKDGD